MVNFLCKYWMSPETANSMVLSTFLSRKKSLVKVRLCLTRIINNTLAPVTLALLCPTIMFQNSVSVKEVSVPESRQLADEKSANTPQPHF